MDVVAVDSIKLLVLMSAGAIFSAVGLWLLLRPKPAGGAKIELFGMKFEASSAGLLVFLIGAAFLATPLIVPERASRPEPGQAKAVAAVPSPTAGSSAPGVIPQRARATGREREPNDDYDSANQISVGDSVSGGTDSSSGDWFVMPVDPSAAALYLKVRSNSWLCNGTLWIYSAEEMEIDSIHMPLQNTAETRKIGLTGTGALFMRIASTNPCSYELFTSYAPL